MNNSEKILIDELIKDKKYLASDLMYKRGYQFVLDVLSLSEWEEEKFKGLLTSNIWKSSYESIKKKLHLPYWNDERYQHLLVPSIFSISINNINNGITLLEEFGVSQYITNRCLRHKTFDLRNLIEYLIDNNISLTVEDFETGTIKLNPILSASNKDIKEKYGIDIKNLKKGVRKK